MLSLPSSKQDLIAVITDSQALCQVLGLQAGILKPSLGKSQLFASLNSCPVIPPPLRSVDDNASHLAFLACKSFAELIKQEFQKKKKKKGN